MRTYFYLFYFFVLCFQLFAQDSEIKKAQQEINQLMKQPGSLKRDSLLVLAYNICAKSYIETSMPDSTAFYLNKIREIAKKQKWKFAEGIAELREGHRLMTKGWSYSALEHYNKALIVFHDIGNRKRESQTYNVLGVNFIFNDSKDTANVLKGIEFAKKANLIAKEAGIISDMAIPLINIVHGYYMIGKYREAIKTGQELARIPYRYRDKFFEHLDLSMCHAYLGEMNEYRRYQDSVMTHKERNTYELFTYYYELGKLALFQNRYADARVYAESMLNAAQELKADKKILDAEELLYKIYKATGNEQLALEYLEKVNKISSRIEKEVSKSAIEELQIKYNTQAQQEQINKLEIQRQQQTQGGLLIGIAIMILLVTYVLWNNRKLVMKNKEISEAMLKGQTSERKRVAADLHDNLGSTMSSLRWTLDAINTNKLSAEEQRVYLSLKEMLENAYNEVRLLSHNLLPEEFEKQGLVEALKSLIKKININTKVKFGLEVSNDLGKLNKTVEFELYTICLELVNNIIKHSQATEGKILLQRSGAKILLQISDNGKGFNEKRTEGKGLKNISMRAETLMAKFSIKSASDGGTLSEIIVPV